MRSGCFKSLNGIEAVVGYFVQISCEGTSVEPKATFLLHFVFLKMRFARIYNSISCSASCWTPCWSAPFPNKAAFLIRVPYSIQPFPTHTYSSFQHQSTKVPLNRNHCPTPSRVTTAMTTPTSIFALCPPPNESFIPISTIPYPHPNKGVNFYLQYARAMASLNPCKFIFFDRPESHVDIVKSQNAPQLYLLP